MLAKERYDATVYAVLTDNAYSMQSMGNAGKSLDLLYSTCNAHSANLLAGDILKQQQNSNVMVNIMAVQKDFKRTALEDRLLKAGVNKPVLSCATPWTSQRGTAESFLQNLSAMKTVTAACENEAEFDKNATTPKPAVSSFCLIKNFSHRPKSYLIY